MKMEIFCNFDEQNFAMGPCKDTCKDIFMKIK